MCMNEEYLKKQEEDQLRAEMRNKATFKKVKDTDKNKDEFSMEDQVGLAFRKTHKSLLNQD